MNEPPSRIITDPRVLAGKPCVRGTRISVEFILELIASGASVADIVAAYPALTREDVTAAVQFAAMAVRSTTLEEIEISS